MLNATQKTNFSLDDPTAVETKACHNLNKNILKAKEMDKINQT